MINQIVARLKKMLAPPTFADEEKTRIARLLNVILLVVILVNLSYTLLIPALYPAEILFIPLSLNFSQIIFTLGAFFLFRRGFVRLTVLLLALFYWVTVSVTVYFSGGLDSVSFSAYILIIFFVGIILSKRAIFAFAALTLLAGFALLYARLNGSLPPDKVTSEPTVAWVAQSVQIILVALLLYLSVDSLQKALKRAQDNEQAMIAINEALQREIARRIQAQVEQERSFSLLQATLESTADGILVVNKAGKITGFNQKFVDMWRIPDAIMARQDDRAALDFVMNQLKEPNSFLANVRYLYEHIEQESFDILEFKNGRIYERYSRPQRLGEETVGRVWSFRDVTEQKRAAAALSQYARHLETLQSVTAALSTSLALDELLDIILEQLAVVLPYDSATIFLLEQDSLLAMAGRGLPHPEQVIGRNFSLENDLYRLMRQTKEPVWLADAQQDPRFEQWGNASYVHGWLCAPLLAHGALTGFMTVDSRQAGAYGPEQAALVQPFAGQAAQAIENARLHEQVQRHAAELEERVAERTRELRQTQEQLLRREKLAAMGQLAGGIAHELRNPLGAIKNAAYALNMLQEEISPEITEMLRVLQVEINTAEQIIKTLLDYARSRPPRRQPVDINELIRVVLVDTVVPPRVHVSTRLDATLPPVPADPGQLIRTFANIIQNSLQAMSKFSPSEREHRLTIETARTGPDWATISIADTGSGIPAENLDKLFEPLFTTKARGIGLGLALVKTFVEGHGGRISVDSREGEGAIFTVWLPLTLPADKSAK